MVVSLSATLVFAAGVSPASGDTAVRFEGVASAYGVDFTLSNPSIPIGFVVQGAGPVAQALLSPIRADGFASMPYPGDVAANITGALGSLLLNGLPLPPYPFYASSSLGSPTASADFPGITLTSVSDADRTSASAVAGTSASGFESTADVRATDGGGIATARTKMTGLQLGGILAIGAVESSATVELRADGTLKRSSSLAIGHIGVPGLGIRLPTTTPSQVPVPVPIPGLPQLGSIPLPPIPLPLGGSVIAAPDIGFVDGSFTITLPGAGPTQTFAIPTQTVLDAFAASGFTLTYQPAEETPSGVIAASLLASTVLPAPPANAIANGETPINFAIGRASASIDPTGGQRPSAPVSRAPSGTSGPVSGASPSNSQSAVASSGSSAALSPSTSRAAGAANSATGTTVFGTNLGSAYSFYLVFVGIGLVSLMSTQLLRLLGVRT